MEGKLAPEERTILDQIIRRGRPLYVRRANLLLSWDEGLLPAAIGERAGLSLRRVRYWLNQFTGRRLHVFPDRVLAMLSPAKSPASQPFAAAELSAVAEETVPLPAPQPRPERPGVQPGDPMSEAGRKILYFHFLRMSDHESGARAGENIEELHDMRVATRRMRAAFVIFGPYFDPQAVAPFLKGLRRTGRDLGAVRDLDVFMEKAGQYLQTLPEGERTSLDPLLASWRQQREEARLRMLTHLDSARYQSFVQGFGAFLRTEGAGALQAPRDQPAPTLVAQVAPSAVYQRLGEVRAFESLLPDAPVTTLHALRIACKRLRYTLEFFEEALGPQAREVIKEVVAMQDYLGALQDAVVASDLLRDFLNTWAERQKSERSAERIDIHGVAKYLAAKQAEIYGLLTSLPAAWQRLNAPELRRRLALALAVL